MLISLKWLKDYVEVNENINELEHAMTMIGQEVEAIEEQGKNLDNVVVGQIIEYGKHPDSEKLTLLKVNTGDEVLQIICGATNHKNNDKVAVAKIGAVLPGDFVIKKTKIRGVESHGMLCSEKELGIGDSHEGIIILPEDAEIGTPLKEYLGLDDVVFELEITPNRPDCLSHIGIAREIAAYYNRKVKYPKANFTTLSESVDDNLKVTVNDKEGCKRYVARIVKDVEIKESPKWLQTKLKAIGIKPINNVVDITNYVMMEYNQPIHAFDYGKIANREIIVRKANNEEKIVTLDGEERILSADDIVIADSEKAIAIAGVMGAENSEIDENTKNVVIEVAYFNPVNIRKTSKRLTLSTDASYRFERGVDIENAVVVANRVAALISELANGNVVDGVIDKYFEKYEPQEVTLDINRLNRFVGKEISIEEVGNIFSGLNFQITESRDNTITIIPPSYRGDITREADLFEEIIRMYGFENIEDILPNESVKSGTVYRETEAIDRAKDYLVGAGLQEVINYSFIPEEMIKFMGFDINNCVKLKNPIVEDFAIMRPTLIYSLLLNIRDNLNRNINDLKIFEVAKTFEKGEKLAIETPKIAIALAGSKDRNIWDVKPNSYDFYDIKAYVESILESFGMKSYQLVRSNNSMYHPGRSADIMVGRDLVGTFGEIHPDFAEKMDIKRERVYVGELDLEKILKYGRDKIKYEGIVKYPAVQRDLAIVVDSNVLVGNMLKDIEKSSNLIEKVELFDVYEGEKIEAGKKSVAINIVLRDKKGTLEEEAINKTIDKILGIVKKKHNGELRSK
jgi:phenylalanyl-tRNA synthetase beta chain